jgi:hypothetical protein
MISSSVELFILKRLNIMSIVLFRELTPTFTGRLLLFAFAGVEKFERATPNTVEKTQQHLRLSL